MNHRLVAFLAAVTVALVFRSVASNQPAAMANAPVVEATSLALAALAQIWRAGRPAAPASTLKKGMP